MLSCLGSGQRLLSTPGCIAQQFLVFLEKKFVISDYNWDDRIKSIAGRFISTFRHLFMDTYRGLSLSLSRLLFAIFVGDAVLRSRADCGTSA